MQISYIYIDCLCAWRTRSIYTYPRICAQCNQLVDYTAELICILALSEILIVSQYEQYILTVLTFYMYK